MRIFQFRGAGGASRLGVQSDGRTLVLQSAHEGIATAIDLFEAQEERGLELRPWLAEAEEAGRFAEVLWDDLARGTDLRLAVPVAAPEVWGAGVTYRRSAEFREEGTGIYDRVYSAERPELFFKAAAWRCAGPGEPIGRRRDSRFTAAEPEVAIVLGRRGTILGFTLANDVSAWDIERENPLYLPQSKVYNGCFAFGPAIVTPDEIDDPYAITLAAASYAGAGRCSPARRPPGSSSGASRSWWNGCGARTRSAPGRCSRPERASSSRSRSGSRRGTWSPCPRPSSAS
jgi:2-keto-4-pentenoate hydratase/2-oxohepta-3-ene-1,7-dioic acid hydratase in catechol pathway